MKFQCLLTRCIMSLTMLIVFPSLSWSAYQWGNVALGGGGFVNAVIAHPNTQNLFYARTDVGGAYRWEEATQSWTPLLDWTSIDETAYQGVEALALDRRNPDALYMLVGTSYWNNGKTAILRSTDRGATFQVTEVTNQFKANGNGMGRQSGEKLVVDPNLGSTLFCGSRYNGLFKSTNSGASWTSVSFPVTSTQNGNGIAFVHMDTIGGTAGTATQRMWVGVSQLNNNLYVSTNGGNNWSLVTGGPSLSPQRIVQAGTNLFITYADSAGPWNMTTGAIYKYAIGSGTWTNISPLANTPFSGISVDPRNHNFVVATTTNKYLQQAWGWGDRIFVSTNGGANWTDIIGSNRVTMDANGFSWIPNHAIHWAGTITLDPFSPARVFVTSGNGIFASTNFSATANHTWKFMCKGLEETVPLDIASLNDGKLFSVIGDYDGNIHSNIFSYNTPTHNPSMGTSTGLAVAGSAQNILARVGSNIYRSTNTGSSWTEVPRPNSGTKGRLGLNSNGAVLLWSPENSTTTHRTSNNGTNWTNVAGLSFNSYPTGDPKNAAKFYAYNSSGGGFFTSTDSGKTFTQSATISGGGSKIIRTVPGIEGDIWVALYGGGLTRSTNSGSNFSKINSVSACAAVGFGKALTGSTFPAVYIWGTVNNVTGLFRSDNQGGSWERINDDAHEFGGPGNGQFVIGDMAVYGRVYMSTVGRGIVVGSLEGPTPILKPVRFKQSVLNYGVRDLLGRVRESRMLE